MRKFSITQFINNNDMTDTFTGDNVLNILLREFDAKVFEVDEHRKSDFRTKEIDSDAKPRYWRIHR